jgi:hypothetical protein
MFRQTRIFAPPTAPFDDDNWAETLIGNIIIPVVVNTNDLEWYWFSRYVGPRGMDDGDCDINSIPINFTDNNGYFRSVRFRYSISDSKANNYENNLSNLIQQNGCRISDFRNYSFVQDLGSDRHLGGVRNVQRRTGRAQIVAELYNAISKLVIDALDGPDANGRFSIELNNSAPANSSFTTPHHLFCNITNVPLRILISVAGVGTEWNPPANPNNFPIQTVPIRF